MTHYRESCPGCRRGAAWPHGHTSACIDEATELFFRMDAEQRRMYLESAYDTPAEFLASLECPEEPVQFPRY